MKKDLVVVVLKSGEVFLQEASSIKDFYSKVSSNVLFFLDDAERVESKINLSTAYKADWKLQYIYYKKPKEIRQKLLNKYFQFWKSGKSEEVTESMIDLWEKNFTSR